MRDKYVSWEKEATSLLLGLDSKDRHDRDFRDNATGAKVEERSPPGSARSPYGETHHSLPDRKVCRSVSAFGYYTNSGW